MRRKGMTLVETVIVLSIIALISGIVLVSYTYVTNRKLEATANTMAADFAWVRQRAVSVHTKSVIRFNVQKNEYQVYNGSVSPANLLKRERCPRGVDLVNVTNEAFVNLTSPPIFNFTAHTGSPDKAIIVNLTQNYRTRWVHVYAPTGNIAIEHP